MKKIFQALTDKQTFHSFLDFIIIEMPNILQLLGIPTLFIFFITGNRLNANFVAILLGLTIGVYLKSKSLIYIKNELNDKNSQINSKKLSKEELEQRFLIYAFITAGILVYIGASVMELILNDPKIANTTSQSQNIFQPFLNSFLTVIPNFKEFLDLAALLLAAISTYFAWKTIKLANDSNRAYISFENFQIGYKKNNSGPVSISISFRNVGNNPFKEINTKLSVFNEELQEKMISQVDPTPSEIPMNASIHPEFPTKWKSDDININPHYLTVEVNYVDAVTMTKYYQCAFMCWKGMADKVVKGITYISIKESEELEQFLNK